MGVATQLTEMGFINGIIGVDKCLTNRVDLEPPSEAVNLHWLGVKLLPPSLQLTEWMNLEEPRVISRCDLTAKYVVYIM